MDTMQGPQLLRYYYYYFAWSPRIEIKNRWLERMLIQSDSVGLWQLLFTWRDQFYCYYYYSNDEVSQRERSGRLADLPCCHTVTCLHVASYAVV